MFDFVQHFRTNEYLRVCSEACLNVYKFKICIGDLFLNYELLVLCLCSLVKEICVVSHCTKYVHTSDIAGRWLNKQHPQAIHK